MSLEPALIEHCSPTLASLKVGSLFSFFTPCLNQLCDQACALTQPLRQKGLSLRIIPAENGRALCYLYRGTHLERILCDPDIASFLKKQGYSCLEPQDALDTLCSRLSESDGFPHEVGLFLGYPLPDVIAFIENKGRNCLCCGHWKAYTDECGARKLFAKYNKCTEVYKRLYVAGRSLEQLTVKQ